MQPQKVERGQEGRHAVQVQISRRASCRRHYSPPSSYNVPPNHTWTRHTQARPLCTPTVRSAATPLRPGGRRQMTGTPGSGGTETGVQPIARPRATVNSAACLLQCPRLESGLAGLPEDPRGEAEHRARRTVGVALLQPAGNRHGSWCASGSPPPTVIPSPGGGAETVAETTLPSRRPRNPSYLRSAGSDAPLPRPGSTSHSGPGPAPHPSWAPASSSLRDCLQAAPLLAGGRRAPSAGMATVPRTQAPPRWGPGWGLQQPSQGRRPEPLWASPRPDSRFQKPPPPAPHGASNSPQ